MIRKVGDAQDKRPGRARRLRKGDPLEVELTVSFRFGDEPGDLLTPIRERNVPMVDSVFKNRDRIIRGFVKLLFKTGLSSPKVVGHIVPLGQRRHRK